MTVVSLRFILRTLANRAITGGSPGQILHETEPRLKICRIAPTAAGRLRCRGMSDLKRHIADLPPEQRAIWAKCVHPSGALFDFNKEEIDQSIPERFEKIVRLHAGR